VNFKECLSKLHTFLYSNGHIQRIFNILSDFLSQISIKIDNVQSSESIFEPKFQLISSKINLEEQFSLSFFYLKASSKRFIYYKSIQILISLTQKVLLRIKKSFENVHQAMEIYSISTDTPRSSITVITLSNN